MTREMEYFMQSDRMIFNGDRVNIHLFTEEFPIIEVRDPEDENASVYHDLSLSIPGLNLEENAWINSKHSFIASWIEKGQYENHISNV